MKRTAAFRWLGAVLLVAMGAPAPADGGVTLTAVQTLYDGTGLAEASAVVSSPDGRHVYAAGRADNALVTFSRDAATGLLTGVQVSRDDVGGVGGLRGVSSLAISRDGAHVYAVGGGEDALAVFARDAVTGFLQFVEIVRDESGPSNVLDAFTGSIAVAADGAHVYVTGFDSVTVFARDTASGALSLVETLRGRDGIEGLQDADAIVVSPDGRHVYVGGSSADALVIFTRDPQRGTLIPTGVLRDGVGSADGLNQVRGISISHDGNTVYIAAYDDDSIAVFDRDPDSGLLTFVQILGDGSGSVRGLDGAYSVAVSNDGKRVYAAGLESSSLVVFERDTATGRLDFVDAFVDGDGAIDGLHGALRVAISPDSANVYVAGLFDDAIAIFAEGRPPRFLAAERSIAGSADGLGGAQAAALSPDGKHLYVAGVRDRAIGVFARDAAAGRLEFVETYAIQCLTLPCLAVTPDGAHLLASALEPGVEVLRRDAATGHLILVQHLDESGSDPDVGAAVVFASAVASSPEGGQVFVTSFSHDTLAVFDREPTSGELRFRMALDTEIDGPTFPTAIAVSTDGMSVYTTGSFDGTVVAFRRDPASGGLERAQVTRDGHDGVAGLRGATALTLSPDDSTLYVVSGGPFISEGPPRDGADALAVFERNREDGRLSFVQTLADGVGGVDGLAGANSVAVLPDGSAVVVAGASDNALAVFTRDPESGHVTFDRTVRDGKGGADGLAGAASVIVSRDGRYLYVTGSTDNALTVFRVIGDDEEVCAGDCAADGSVSIGELIVCVNIALGRGKLAECIECDADGSGAVDISDLIRSVANSLNGCP